MIEIVEAMTTYSGGVLNQFQLQLDAKVQNYPMFIWGQIVVNLVHRISPSFEKNHKSL